MAKSRYGDARVLDGRYFATNSLPVLAAGYKELDLLAGVRTFEHVFSRGERVDHLASRFFNDEGYWWVICLCNNIDYPFASGGLVPGKKLRIPFDVKDVLNKIMK